jgi:hypothetical protein
MSQRRSVRRGASKEDMVHLGERRHGVHHSRFGMQSETVGFGVYFFLLERSERRAIKRVDNGLRKRPALF